MRAIPHVNSRYPLWDHPGLVHSVAKGRGYLPDAEEGKRETLVTTVLDAEPLQVLRVLGPSWLPAIAAIGLGGVFIFSTFELWLPVLASSFIFLTALLYWLWTGTAVIPEKSSKDIGNGSKLPLYQAGPSSVGWWAMFITMTGDLTAFLAVVFGYFFFWTIHADFPPNGSAVPGWLWPTLAGIGAVTIWILTVGTRMLNSSNRVNAARICLALSLLAILLTAASLAAGPWRAGLDPTKHAYPAIVWALVLWVIAHLAVGIIMNAYCLARSVAGKMTPSHDADIWNVSLYGHFVTASVLITAAVIGGVPLLT
jgi:cytochrome c oxidase subunit I+III